MISKIKSAFEKIRNQREQFHEQQKLIEEIYTARRRLEALRIGFDEVSDEDLTEYFIYEKRAAELHHKYLLKLCGKALPEPGPVSFPAFFRTFF